MAEPATMLRVFVASPSDVREERDRLEDIVEDLNLGIARDRGLVLELVRWETHTWPALGEDAQEVVNRQIGPYDVFIGIMWKRFGTPTKRAESGTKEEFDLAYELWKKYGRPHIMFYFNKAPYSLASLEEIEQCRKVLAFKKELAKRGLYWEYKSLDEFEKYVRRHLTQLIRSWGAPVRPNGTGAVASPAGGPARHEQPASFQERLFRLGINWVQVGIAGVIGLLIALGAWFILNAGLDLVASLFGTPTATITAISAIVPPTFTPTAAGTPTATSELITATPKAAPADTPLTTQSPKPIDTPVPPTRTPMPTPTALSDQINIIKEVIPSDWQPEELRKVDLDGDDEEEWLLIYRQTSAPNSPLGGVIYDAQVGISPLQPRLELPYRPAYLVPYRLLPDLGPGKGQGYLGETGYRIETYDTDGDEKQDELVILGYSWAPNPTQMAFFRWENKEAGYKLTAHFHGDGGVEAARPREDDGGPIEAVTTKEKKHDRSHICQKTVYRRKKDDVTYEKVSGPFLDFTYDVPSRPFYPEAAVLAYYLSLAGGEGSPDGYTTDRGQVATQNLAETEFGSEAGARVNAVIGLTYPGLISKENINVYSNEAAPGGFSYIEYADVTINVVIGSIPMEITWRLLNVSSGKLNEEVTWKLDSIISARKLIE